MDLGLKDKIAVVTGGSMGIGYAIAEELLREGAIVTIAGRNEEHLSAAKKTLSAIAGADRIQTVAADCSKEADTNRLAREAAHDGKIDVWVNNVGTNFGRKGELYSEEELDALIAICFKATVFGSQAAYTYMKGHGGSIVNIASLAARCASCGRSTIYAALKSAVVGLTNTTAGEYAAYGIRVNAVLPGFTATPLVKKSIADGLMSQLELDRQLSGILERRMADPSEIAKPVVFLASDAASFITAESLEVSGGHSRVLNPWYSYEKREKEEGI
jgi:NAD(P)-dependent dehydrogenase (short-subunit alcohol dehydrogenase family)